MKARIAELIAALRRAEVPVSVAEAMDAAQAAAMAGVARPVLRDALAATLVKDERDRSVFLVAFDAIFPARARDVARTPGRKKARSASVSSGDGSAGSSGATDAGSTGASVTPSRSTASPSATGAERRGSPEGSEAERAAAGSRAKTNAASVDHEASDDRGDQASDAARGSDEQRDDGAAEASAAARHHERERRLRALPLRAMSPHDVEQCAELARAIAARITARVRRRRQPRTTGRLDFRRTIRAAVPRGGIPFERRYRGRRPGRPELVALCDLSASAATATDFFLALLAPSTAYFRRVQLFGYVDRLVEIEFAAGQVRPAAPVDLMARSDFGRVLRDLLETERAVLTADAVLLVLGDARNNRRPPRADLLAAARVRVRRALWLNPDPRERWNTGDSVIAAYAKHVDAVVACGTLGELEHALATVAKL